MIMLTIFLCVFNFVLRVLIWLNNFNQDEKIGERMQSRARNGDFRVRERERERSHLRQHFSRLFIEERIGKLKGTRKRNLVLNMTETERRNRLSK